MDNEEEDSSGKTADSMGASVFQQLIDIFVRPEVERRRAEGRLGESFVLKAAQVICSADGKPNEIRLNEEVLPDTEDPNCGHATLVRLGAHWHVAFDFRYNRGRSEVLLSRAREFLSAATAAHDNQAWSAFAYNLYTTMELAAKAELALTGDPDLLRSKKHDYVRSRFNLWRSRGNVDDAHSSALNKLWKLRDPSAYSWETFTMSPEDASALLADVSDFVERVAARLVRRGPADD